MLQLMHKDCIQFLTVVPHFSSSVALQTVSNRFCLAAKPSKILFAQSSQRYLGRPLFRFCSYSPDTAVFVNCSLPVCSNVLT